MTISINTEPRRGCCPLCRSGIETAGYVCDDNRMRMFLCTIHAMKLLRIVLAASPNASGDAEAPPATRRAG